MTLAWHGRPARVEGYLRGGVTLVYESHPTRAPDADHRPPPHPLEYAGQFRESRRRLLPRHQSFAGMFAVVPATVLAALTILFVAAVVARAGFGAAGVLCLFVPCTLAAIISGLLGLTEETPRGERRDGTLAKWSLLVTAGCWLVAAILLLVGWILH